MNKTFVKLAAVAMAALVSTATMAQDGGNATTSNLKIGYTNVAYIFNISPRAKEIENEIKTRTTMLQKQIEEKEQELQSKFETYQKQRESMMESIRADKEQELRNLDAAIMNLRKNGEAELKNKYEELVSPESDRISDAVKSVAKENGFTYIINGDPQILLYGQEGLDVTPMVLKKLGITPPPPGSNPSTARPAAGGSSAPASPGSTGARPAPGSGTNYKPKPKK